MTSAIVSLAKPAHTVGLTKNKTNNTIVKMFIKNSGGTIHCLQLFVSGITFFVLVYFLKQNIIIFYLSSFFFFFFLLLLFFFIKIIIFLFNNNNIY